MRPTFYLVELFSGSGSFGDAAARAARRLGYRFERLSLDVHAKYRPSVRADILSWRYLKELPEFLRGRGPADVLWMHASPPCNEYSKAKTGLPRDLDGADKLVRRVLRIMRYLKPRFFTIENPVGLLQHRPCMRRLARFKKVASYCHFGRPFQKHTNIWTNVDVELPVCVGATRCRAKRETGRHPLAATTRPHYAGGLRSAQPGQARMPVEHLYRIPSRLVRLLVNSALAAER